jgi:hypothetical protein
MIVVIVSAAMVILLAVALSFTQRLKKRIDTDVPHKVGPPVRLNVSPQSAERLARLSSEPVFVKQSPDGTRVQIDNRPLVPLVMLTDHDAVLGLNEAIMAATSRFGGTWSALLSSDDDGGVSVQRLS